MAREPALYASFKRFSDKLRRVVTLRCTKIWSYFLETSRWHLRCYYREFENSLIKPRPWYAVKNRWGLMERHRVQKHYCRIFVYHWYQLVGICRRYIRFLHTRRLPGWQYYTWRHSQYHVWRCNGTCWKHSPYFFKGLTCRFSFRYFFLECQLHDCEVWKWESTHSRLQTLGLSIWEHLANNTIQRWRLLCWISHWCKLLKKCCDLLRTCSVILEWRYLCQLFRIIVSRFQSFWMYKYRCESITDFWLNDFDSIRWCYT